MDKYTNKSEDCAIESEETAEQLTEFSLEFLGFKRKTGKSNENLNTAVENYIREKLPDMKVKTVKIMLGSLLVATIPFLSINSSIMKAAGNPIESTDIYNIDDNTLQQSDTPIISAPSEESAELSKPTETIKPTTTPVKHAPTPVRPAATPVKPTTTPIEQSGLPNGIWGLGAQGEDVKKIQNALIKIGYLLSADGYFGVGTKNAISDFQRQYPELADDGIYGPTLKSYLQNAIINGPFIVKNPIDITALVNKTYRLPTDYVPGGMVIPNVPFTTEEYDDSKLLRQVAASALEQMFAQAKVNNISLFALSGYRSYTLQESIFKSSVIKYGSVEKANQWSAKPGHSEHQTGLTMDITSPSVGYGLTQSFGTTKEGLWVKSNCYKYGFIIRYPKGKETITGYQYEPWHLRYVGKETAQKIYSMNITLDEFYKMK